MERASSPEPLSDPPIVSVVVPTYRRPELLARCVRALVAQEYPADRLQVIVVEDGGVEVGVPREGRLGGGKPERSGAGASEWVVADARAETSIELVYLRVPSAGPAAARNAGWRRAVGEIVAFTDDDTIPDRRWVTEAIRCFAAGADAVTGRTVVPLPDRPTDAERNVRGLESASFATCNAFCRRDLLAAVGGFDPRFRWAYREDSDLEFRLLDAGARIVRNDAAVVVHPPRLERPFVSLRQQQNQLFDALLYRKHPARFRATIAAGPPWRYYAIAAAQLLNLAGIAAGRPALAAGAGAVWLGLVGRFCAARLQGASRRPAHVADMLVTSLLIPPLALYWRLRGALQFRVRFL